ncbi:MAG: hypothetical protein QOK28_3375 [Actinomycetota bacterium]|jgi:uncharacterized protein YodC (DUF2158 family)
MDDCRIIGVRHETTDGPRVAYVDRPQKATPELLQAAEPAVSQVLRLAAPCEEARCAHFDGHDCRLAQRVVQLLDPVVKSLPAGTIRTECRWFAQEGRAACERCPQVLTEIHHPTELQSAVALPS